jgi:transmembrane protein EpsG
MAYLIIILTISYMTAVFSVRYPMREKGGLGQLLPNPAGFAVPALLFTVFSGLRNNLGDTYYNMHSYNLLTDDMPKPEIGSRDILYNYLIYILRQITDKPQLLIFIGAVLSCIPVIYILYRYSVAYELSIFLFVATSYYSFSFNGMRQYMAAGILILGTKYLFSQEKKAWIKFTLIVLLAAGLHSSALIMIPAYCIVRRKAWSLTSFAVIILTAVATLVFDAFLPQFLNLVAQSDYSIYSDTGWFVNGEETGASFIRVIVVATPLFIAYLSKERIKQLGKTGDILVNMAVLNFSFYLISLYNWIFARFAIYTSIYYILLLTWLIKNSFKKKDRYKVYIACIVLYSLYFWAVRYSIVGYRSNFF